MAALSQQIRRSSYSWEASQEWTVGYDVVDLTYFSQKTEKRVSKIERRGLFARESICKGEVEVVKGVA